MAVGLITWTIVTFLLAVLFLEQIAYDPRAALRCLHHPDYRALSPIMGQFELAVIRIARNLAKLATQNDPIAIACSTLIVTIT